MATSQSSGYFHLLGVRYGFPDRHIFVGILWQTEEIIFSEMFFFLSTRTALING